GTSLPSPATLGRICAFFAIDQGDILLAPSAFAAMADARPKEPGPLPPPLFAPTVDRIATHFPDSSRKLERYCGYYFGYYCSPAYPRKVIKSLSRICRSGDFFTTGRSSAWSTSAGRTPASRSANTPARWCTPRTASTSPTATCS